MKDIYRKALSEVNEVLNKSDKEIINKIPNKFKSFIDKNMDKSYKVQIDIEKSILEQNISNEAKSIIALIYRDYICSKEEKRTLIEIEILNKKKNEQMKKEKYPINFLTNKCE